MNVEWLGVYKWKQWGLPRLLSDHCPVVLSEIDKDWGPKPFRILDV